jgi:hypothetical protein
VASVYFDLLPFVQPRHCRRSIRALWIAAGLWLAIGPVTARAQTFVTDPPPAVGTKVVALLAPVAGGRLQIALVKNGTGAVKRVTVTLTPLVSSAGDTLRPELVAGERTAAPGSELVFDAVGKTFLDLAIEVPALAVAGPYTGNLYVTVDGRAPARQAISIAAATLARPATLQVLPESGVREHTLTLPFLPSRFEPPAKLDRSRGPVFDLRFGDGSGGWTVRGVQAGPASVVKAPGSFNFSDHAAWYDDKGELVPMPVAAEATGRTLRLQLGGLIAGEYNVTVPFFANNASGEPKKVTLVVFAKHRVFYAVLCLLFALLTSFWASKLVAIREDRTRLVGRINDLRPSWLQNEPQNLAIAWIQSIVDQAKRLSRRRLLSSVETLHGRLETARTMLLVLDRLRRVRQEIRQSALPRLARARALKVAERIGDRLDPEASQDDLTSLGIEISELRGWTREGESARRYSANLNASIQQLLADVRLNTIESSHAVAIGALVETLKTPPPSPDSASPVEALEALEAREDCYATLKILWERRSAPEFADLLVVSDKGSDTVFDLADQRAWARLAARRENVRVDLVSHRNGLTPEADEPLTFRFSTGDLSLDATYLVMHGLAYEWSFTIVGADGRQVRLATVTTRSPVAPVFAPFAGTLKPAVTLKPTTFTPAREPGFLPCAGAEIAVARSRRFTVANGFSTGEVLQLILAFAVAVITGLQTFYYKTAGFGSLSDYLALFAWGATVDQAKNLLQRLPSAAFTQPAGAGALAVASTSADPPLPNAGPARVAELPLSRP